MAPPEPQRLSYPLGAHSVVLDCGAYQGDFARVAVERWGCHVYAFEPVPSFAAALSLPNVSVLGYGIAGANARAPIAVLNDSSSRNKSATAADPIADFRDVVEVFSELELGNVDLMKVNIEGDEYSLLDRMIDTGLILRVRFLQVQFHGQGADARGPDGHRAAIRAELEKTHRQQWVWEDGWPTWSWESWELR